MAIDIITKNGIGPPPDTTLRRGELALDMSTDPPELYTSTDGTDIVPISSAAYSAGGAYVPFTQPTNVGDFTRYLSFDAWRATTDGRVNFPIPAGQIFLLTALPVRSTNAAATNLDIDGIRIKNGTIRGSRIGTGDGQQSAFKFNPPILVQNSISFDASRSTGDCLIVGYFQPA